MRRCTGSSVINIRLCLNDALCQKGKSHFYSSPWNFGWLVSLVLTWWWSGDIGFHCHRFTYVPSLLPLSFFFYFLKINYISVCIPFVQPSYLSHVSEITWMLTQQIIARGRCNLAFCSGSRPTWNWHYRRPSQILHSEYQVLGKPFFLALPFPLQLWALNLYPVEHTRCL